MLANADKLGFDTGLFVDHPFIKTKTTCLFLELFVLMDYGTGAIFGCPGHDQRDFDFCKKYTPANYKGSFHGKDEPLTEAYTGSGKLINSGLLNGLDEEKAKNKIINEIEQKNLGSKKTYTD